MSQTSPSNGQSTNAATPANSNSPGSPAGSASGHSVGNDPPAGRGRALLAVTAAVAVAGLAYGAWWWTQERGLVRTDNAYVQAPLVQLSPQLAGTVVQVLVEDTDRVAAGQVLVRLDGSDARIALERAEAVLAQTVREVRGLYANNLALAATVRLRESEVARAQAEVERKADDLQRRQPLLGSGAIGAEELRHTENALLAARSALTGAQSALVAAREQEAANRALTEGTRIDRHPNVERAAIAVREAWLALQRTEIRAPVAGQIARRTVQVGQRVAPGAPLMAITALDEAWIDANFKEVQLRDIRPGQRVRLSADVWGSRVHYDGRVSGIGAGTGSAFALLPAQNATGNWIKIVQRVPVRIELNPDQLANHPLRIGLSMQVVIDIRHSEPPRTGDEKPRASNGAADEKPRASGSTTVFDISTAEIDRRIEQLIAAHLGRGGALR
jgi:membrane fusion protein (multidrug efflux system)